MIHICVQSLFFLLQKIGYWVCAMTRHNASQTSIYYWQQILLLTLLMIPLHFLWAKSNNRTRGQSECDVTFFFFDSFVHIYGAVRLLFHSLLKTVGRMGGFVWNGTSKVKRGGTMLDFDRKGGGRSKKLDNFHGRHMCIVCKLQNTTDYTILNQTAPDGFWHLRNVEYGSINSREWWFVMMELVRTE